jgi:hypothetical protein
VLNCLKDRVGQNPVYNGHTVVSQETLHVGAVLFNTYRPWATLRTKGRFCILNEREENRKEEKGQAG